MAIILKRSSDFFASFFKLSVRLNENKVGKIAQGEEKEFPLTNSRSTLQVKQLGSKSNKLTVTDGDYIKINLASWVFWEFISLFILGVIVGNLTGPSQWISFSLIIIGFFIFNYFVDTFKLTKIDND
ncbi:MAG: hypothetical protein L0L57_07590 [Alkalibacterium sp.]|nr:hypothetical protein [Alkalibacterium sp.]